ncbi:MAG: VanZ family protein [Elusimicrobia bacterium]|nr:VanZ family protein [Elusimicrobiota bacterium]
MAAGYVGLIYATLPVAPAPLAFLRAHGMLRITLDFAFAACGLAVAALLYFRRAGAWRYAALVGVVVAYASVARHVRLPEEQVHFIQYGLVGVLFFRAVSLHERRRPVAFALALVIAVVAGALDEFIQGHVPNRHYDPRDIYLDAVSSFLGLLVSALLPPPSSETD